MKLTAKQKGILLDISFGGKPQPHSVTLGPNGDVCHPPRKIPFPLPSACAHHVVITHVLEYLPVGLFFDWWDEVWRITKPYGIIYVSGPYGGDESAGWLSDPCHQTRVIEQSFMWLDPRTPLYAIHPQVGRPVPKPWWTLGVSRVPGTESTISYNVMLQKQPEKEARRGKK